MSHNTLPYFEPSPVEVLMDGARRGERERRARGRRPMIASSIPPSDGDVVWAKMPGFTFWPAKVED